MFEVLYFTLSTMGTVLNGLRLFDKKSVTLDVKIHLVHLPHMSMQNREKPNQVPAQLYGSTDDAEESDPAVPASDGTRLRWGYQQSYERCRGRNTCIWWEITLLIQSPLVALTKRKTIIYETNPHNHTYLLESRVAVTNFKLMTHTKQCTRK